jgi:hypothetical protein
MLSRIGCLLVVIGGIILYIFFMTDTIGQSEGNSFLVGAGLVLIGLFFWRRGRPSNPQPSARFKTLRQFRTKDPEE